MRRILFSVCGVGFGHATRTWDIIKHLRGKNGVEFRATSYSSGSKYLREKNLDFTEISGVKWSENAYGFSLSETIFKNIVDLPSLTRSYTKLTETIAHFNPDIIFSDSDPFAYTAAVLKKVEKNYVLTHLPLLTREDHLHSRIFKENRRGFLYLKFLESFLSKHCDKVITPVIHPYDVDEENYFQTHLIVRKKPEELDSVEEIKEKKELERDFYLVPIPGAPVGKGVLFKMVQYFKRNFPEENFIVTNFPNITEKKELGNLTLFPYVKNFLAYLKAAKGIISLAGYSTITESLVYGTPVLAIPEYQIEHLIIASLLERDGYGKAIFPWEREEGLQERKIREFFHSVEDMEQRIRRREFKGDGGRQIAKFLMKHTFSGESSENLLSTTTT